MNSNERTLEFKTKPSTEIVTLDELKLTQSIMNEDIPEHFEFFQDILDMCKKKKIKTSVGDIFVNNGGLSKFPGAAIIKRLEDKHGKKNIQAYLIRRVLTVIAFTEYSKPDMTYGIALNYLQDGVQVATGYNVAACSNLCIYGENLIGTYGSGRGNNINYNKLLEHIEGWLDNLKSKVAEDDKVIKTFKSIQFNHESANEFFGRLMRKAMESKVLKDVHAPLGEQQVKEYQRLYLKKINYNRNEEAMNLVPSLWDFVNIGTEILALDKTDPFTVLKANNDINKYVMDEYLEDAVIIPEFEVLNEVK